jgi:hypothetical protein
MEKESMRILIADVDVGESGKPGSDYANRNAKVFWCGISCCEADLRCGSGHFDGYPTDADETGTAAEIPHPGAIERQFRSPTLDELLSFGLTAIERDAAFDDKQKSEMREALRLAVFEALDLEATLDAVCYAVCATGADENGVGNHLGPWALELIGRVGLEMFSSKELLKPTLVGEADAGDPGKPGSEYTKRTAQVYSLALGRYELMLWCGSGSVDGYPVVVRGVRRTIDIPDDGSIERHYRAPTLTDLLALGLTEVENDAQFDDKQKSEMGEAIRQAVDVAVLKAATGDDCVEGPVVRLATSGD